MNSMQVKILVVKSKKEYRVNIITLLIYVDNIRFGNNMNQQNVITVVNVDNIN